MDFIILGLIGIFNTYLIELLILVFKLIFREHYIFWSQTDHYYTRKLEKYLLENSSIISKRDLDKGEIRPLGICISIKKFYFAFIDSYADSDSKSSETITTIYYFGKLPFEIKKADNSVQNNDNSNSESDSEEEDDEQKKLKNYVNCITYNGSSYRSSFKKVKLPFPFKPYPKQQDIIMDIDYIFKNHDNKIARILLTGSTGVGKSFIAKLLAQKYNSSFCFEIKLNNPGVDLRELYNTAEVDSYKKPLILLIDEFDILIENIHHQKNYTPHKWFRTPIYNKDTYNTFMSEYTLLFPYVIYVFTMNRTKKEINDLDQSYIRPGRIDKIYEM